MSNRASDLADQITSRNSASASRSRFGRDGGNEIRKEDTTSNNTQRVVDRRDDPERRRKHEENRGGSQSVRIGVSSFLAQLGAGQRAPTDHAGTVETIDQAHRAVSLKTADGKFVAIDVPKSAKRFSELKVGDKVSVTYNNNVMVRLKPPGEAAVGNR
jgi:hypothetical protein